MKVDFELEIHRSFGGNPEREGRPISVYIADRTSHCRILEINFGLAEFMEILTGRGGITAEGELYIENPIGCTPEHKEEVVSRPKDYARDEKEASKILKPFEIDGWEARRDDLYNHHRWVGTKEVKVSFYRFIRPDGTVWEPSE